MLKKLKLRIWVRSPSEQTWPSTKKSDGKEQFATTGSMDGCSILPETQIVGIRLSGDNTLVLSVGIPFSIGELPEKGQSLTSNRH